MDQITDNLAVCGAQKARDIGQDFDTVVSLAAPNDYTTKKFLIDDGEHDYDKFKEATDYVVDQLENGDNVLIHCMAGISRSVSVCIATCVVHYGMSYNEAYDNCQRGFQHPSSELVESVKKYIDESN